jgi:2,3-bisphosphoglycerate-independent phosphoglycerate mutase
MLVILDGLADRVWPELEGRTPLEAARTPNLDRLASMGQTGLLHPLGRGRAPGSELAHFTLFGYPRELYPGRAVFEAVGEGLPLEIGEVVFRGLFGTVEPREDGSLLLTAHKAEIDDVHCERLADAVSHFEHGGVTLKFAFTADRQGVLYVSGHSSEDVTDADPYVTGLPIPDVLPLSDAGDPEAAAATAGAVRKYVKWAYRELSAHPVNLTRRGAELPEANFLLLKWSGRKRDLPSFERLTGFKGASVSWGVLYRGLATELGMDWLGTPYLPDTAEDVAMRIDRAADALEDGSDFVHVHTKAPDVAGHTKDPHAKVAAIEACDEGLGRLFERGLAEGDDLLIVTGDHGTPSGTPLIHSGDPVPLVVVGRYAWADDVAAFDEKRCAGGSLGHLDGEELMPTVLDLTDRVKYAGAKLTPEVGPFWPREYPTLTVDD